MWKRPCGVRESGTTGAAAAAASGVFPPSFPGGWRRRRDAATSRPRARETRFPEGSLALLPLSATFGATGTAPLSLRWTRGGPRAEPSGPRLAVAVLLLALTVVHALWAPTTLLRLERAVVAAAEARRSAANGTIRAGSGISADKQTIFVKTLHPLLNCLTALTARGTSVWLLPRRLPPVLAGAARVDRLLRASPATARVDAAFLLLASLFFLLLHLPLAGYHLRQLSAFRGAWGTAWEAFSLFGILSAAAVEFQFVILCRLASSRLARVNRRLAELGGEFVTAGGTAARGGPSPGALRAAHLLLRRLMDATDGIYRVHLLVSVFSSVSKILFNLYFSIFGFVPSSASLPNSFRRGQTYIVCFWTAYYCLRFLLVVLFADAASSEWRKTRVALAFVDPRRFPPPERDEVEMFRQEQFSAGDFRFSACGLFHIDMALVTSTFSSGITYLVVMAQFRTPDGTHHE